MPHPVKLVQSKSNETSTTKSVKTMSTDETLTLEIRKDDDGISLKGTTPPLVLTITMHEHGPTVELSHADLRIESLGDVSIEGDHLQLKGRESCSIETQGNLKVRADEEMNLESTQDCILKANVIHLN